ncbi:MAG: 50S ribosomal protein L20 [Spirochaetia bacterium]|nr:50S ribosomal protein L20 [Spirochaetia bacterium]
MRSVNGTIRKNRRKKILKRAKGFRGGRRKLFRTAKDAIMKSDMWAYRDRKTKKRDFRKLWIVRINAACRQEGVSYSKFMHDLKKAGIELNRKSLSEIVVRQPEVFKEILKEVTTKAA